MSGAEIGRVAYLPGHPRVPAGAGV
jgi:hypothetical protein